LSIREKSVPSRSIAIVSRFLHCMPHGKPARALLTGFTNLPAKDLHPLE
jgi:hypothetical protein